MHTFVLRRVLTFPLREMIPILLALIVTCRSKSIVTLYENLFENYNKVKDILLYRVCIATIANESIKNIPAMSSDSMLTPIDISIDVDWISKVETSQSQLFVSTYKVYDIYLKDLRYQLQ